MFTEMLDDDERTALLDLLTYLSAVDGEVSAEEVAFIEDAARRFGLPQPSTATLGRSTEQDLATICSRFKRPKAAAIALAELINIGFADGHYDESERRGVRAIGRLMGADDDLVGQLEDWVTCGVEWKARGRRLMGLNT